MRILHLITLIFASLTSSFVFATSETALFDRGICLLDMASAVENLANSEASCLAGVNMPMNLFATRIATSPQFNQLLLAAKEIGIFEASNSKSRSTLKSWPKAFTESSALAIGVYLVHEEYKIPKDASLRINYFNVFLVSLFAQSIGCAGIEDSKLEKLAACAGVTR